MSCLSSSAMAEEAPALDMLDEYWFFSNTLGKQDGGRTRPPLPSTSLSSGSGGAKGSEDRPADGKSRFYPTSWCRRLLRTPSRHVGMLANNDDEIAEEAGDEEVEDDDMNWSSIYEGILRTRIAAERGGVGRLHRAPSMPVPSTMGYGEAATTKSTPSIPRLRHSYSTLERHCRSHTPTKGNRTPTTSGGGGQTRREFRSFSTSQQHPDMDARQTSAASIGEWKSSSALESIEVQGFKDLGFVFDQEELRESLADVLPGLRDSKSTPQKSSRSGSASGSASPSDNEDANRNGIGVDDVGSDMGDGTVRRPYLSEAWHHGALPAATAAAGIRLQQADARSAAEMKDQIRMWAQAVACNVRQEC